MYEMQITQKQKDILDLATKKGDEADLLIISKVHLLDDKIEIIEKEIDKGNSAMELALKFAEMKKGEDGKTPTKDELVKIIQPLIPNVKDGKDGHTPSKKELLDIIKPLIPDVKDGKDPSDKHLSTLIEKLIPPPVLLDEVAITNTIEKNIENNIPKLGERIRDALELLTEDSRLDATAIKNLPEVVKQHNVIAHPTAFWNLSDVDVSGIAVGQAIKWDGVRWIPYTPVGGNTSVYNEVVSGSATTFTLAHTPVSTTVRVYALGQRLSPTTDYSLVGATITTVSSWEAGDITSDYEY